MDINYKKYNGFQRHNKSRHLVAKELKLSDAQYRLWDLITAICGWDRKYEHLYRRVQITQKEIAVVLNWDASKVCRINNSLIKSGLIERVNRCEYLVKVLAERGSEEEDNQQIANIQERLAKAQKPHADVQVNIANSQDNKSYLDSSPLVSFKSNCPLRTDSEYLEIWREYKYPSYFDVSDMKYIDQEISKERVNCPN